MRKTKITVILCDSFCVVFPPTRHRSRRLSPKLFKDLNISSAGLHGALSNWGSDSDQYRKCYTGTFPKQFLCFISKSETKAHHVSSPQSSPPQPLICCSWGRRCLSRGPTCSVPLICRANLQRQIYWHQAAVTWVRIRQEERKRQTTSDATWSCQLKSKLQGVQPKRGWQ